MHVACGHLAVRWIQCNLASGVEHTVDRNSLRIWTNRGGRVIGMDVLERHLSSVKVRTGSSASPSWRDGSTNQEIYRVVKPDHAKGVRVASRLRPTI